MLNLNNIYNYDCMEGLSYLPDKSIDLCITSPPFWNLRDYGTEGQIGLEETPQVYIDKLVDVFREVRRVLKDEGSFYLNLGDTYSTHSSSSKKHTHNFRKADVAAENGIGTMKKGKTGLPEKNLVGIPWRVALALQSDGWILRNDIIWHKPNPTPGGQGKAFDRYTVSHEYLFFFTKKHKYLFNGEDVRTETKARPKDVWSITTKPFKGAHFAVYPPELITKPILASSPEEGIVLDPFMGSGTTGVVSQSLNRNYIGFELNSEYIEIANKRIDDHIIKQQIKKQIVK